MSTYNGEKFLREQLDSILSQEGVDVRLLVRDDGSNDNTCAILEEYSCKHKRIDVVCGANVGFVKSFSNLVELAADYKTHVDYYAFSDQDDVWFPDKLSTGAEILSKMNQEKPLLFSSNSTYIDAEGNALGNFHEKEPYRTKENVMIYPTEQGCSMMFNKKAVELYNMHPPMVAWHDRWMCLICNFMGGMVYCHEPLFGYRVHGGNALGKRDNFFRHLKYQFNLFINPQSNNFPIILEFNKAFKHDLPSPNMSFLNVYIGYKHSMRKKLQLMSSKYQISLNWINRLKKIVLIFENGL